MYVKTGGDWQEFVIDARSTVTRTLARSPIRTFTPTPPVNVLLSTVNPKIGPRLLMHGVLGATDVPPPQAADVTSAVKTAADATRAARAARSATVFMLRIGASYSTGGTSFDSAFTPRMVWPNFIR